MCFVSAKLRVIMNSHLATIAFDRCSPRLQLDASNYSRQILIVDSSKFPQKNLDIRGNRQAPKNSHL